MSISTNVHHVEKLSAEVRVFPGDFVSISIEVTMRASHAKQSDDARIVYFLKPSMEGKAQRIAAAINEIMNAPDDAAGDDPAVETLAAE